MTKIIINIDTLHVDTIHTGDVTHGQGQGFGMNPLLGALLSGILSGAAKVHMRGDDTPQASDQPADAPQPAQDQQPVPSAQETPQDTAALDAAPQAPSVQYQWPTINDDLSIFDSAKNSYDYIDSDYDLPEVIEVTDDWFRVRGHFTSKTGKGTRKVTLKVARSEVADGSVKYTIAG